jgi:hypothetical protein
MTTQVRPAIDADQRRTTGKCSWRVRLASIEGAAPAGLACAVRWSMPRSHACGALRRRRVPRVMIVLLSAEPGCRGCRFVQAQRFVA